MELNFNHCYNAARTLHESGEHLKAFKELKQVMEYPGQMHGDGEWALGWNLLGSIAGAMGFEKLSHLAIRAADFPDDPKVLYNLGYELVEVHLPKIAATPLNQAHLMCPQNEAILSELSTAFENAGCYDLAYMNLSCCEEIIKESFMCRYLLAFNAIMTGRLEECRKAAKSLEDPPDSNYHFMRDRILQFIQRADTVASLSGLDQQDLRGWHYVLSGSVLLHLSPHGFEEAMRGRYAYVQDSFALLRLGMERVRASLQTWGEEVEQVVYFSNRNSEILARAYGALENLPVVSWKEVPPESPGLYVAYDLKDSSSEFLQFIHHRRPGQWLWAHALQWTEDFPLTADFHTYLYQHKVAPWCADSLQVDPETGEMTCMARPEAVVEVLVKSILEAEIEHNEVDEMENFLAFIQAVGPLPQNCCREKYFQGSPVQSNRFE